MREHSGTPAYIAPEIIKDKGYKGFKADLWSAGVVLFALLYGTVPFKANNMKELHSQIMSAKYNFKDTPVSEAAKDLIRGLLCVDPVARLGVSQVLKHEWMKGAELLSTDIFNPEEKEVIRSEFTYNDPSRYIRNEKINKDKEPWDCFTELNLDSMNCTLRNASTKSLILAPFNSSMSDVEEFFKESFKMAPMEPKKEMIKFAARCRDQDRQYEINNNAELDNGVYHKFVYSSKDSGEKEKEEADGEN
jgi:serine/threonine protein kinase